MDHRIGLDNFWRDNRLLIERSKIKICFSRQNLPHNMSLTTLVAKCFELDELDCEKFVDFNREMWNDADSKKLHSAVTNCTVESLTELVEAIQQDEVRNSSLFGCSV
jgi:hypothetical protein